MKTKRALSLFLIFIFTLFACTVMVACGNSAAGNECTHDDANTDGKCDKCGESVGAPDEKLVLVEDGIPTFQFVIPQNTPVSIQTQAKSTFNTINKVLNKDAKTVTESSGNAQDIEIIVGSPKFRGAEYAIDPHYLGPEGYAVKVIGTKVLLLFGSENASAPAMNHLKTVLFGITSKTKKLTDVAVEEDKLIESIQHFTLENATIAGNDLRDYALEYSTFFVDEARELQQSLYNTAGIWLPLRTSSDSQKVVNLREIENGGEGTTPEGFRVYVDENANLVIETEFPNKFKDSVDAFLADTLLKSGTTSFNFDQDYVYSGFNARNIYYEDFGAKGNGRTDDFEAIKECHKYANQYGHTVNGKPGATYYIGKNDAGTAASIRTDVNWNGCKFIFDDTELTQPLTAEQNGGAEVLKSAGWDVAVFSVDSEYKPTTYTYSDLPITQLKKGADNVGFAPGFPALVLVYNSNVRHYIRYGLNEDEGQDQNEVLLVDEYGNIDPSTPVQWEYEAITKIMVQRVDDKPITISGGEFNAEAGIDNRAYIEQRYNKGRSLYVYCYRNINVFRSNVIIENIKHEYTGFVPYEEGGSGAPYIGFTYIRRSNNVTVRGMDYMCPPTYYLETDSRNNMGSYEIMAGVSNNLKYENSTQSNFFQKDGSVEFQGFMATNFCKNLSFDNMFACSFDAHCGVYNATVKNSTVEHLNFIGDGEILLENVTLYADGRLHSSINLRSDYGSTWAGNITVNSLEFRYAEELGDDECFTIMHADWYNHNFGYTVHTPRNIVLNDISIVKFTYGIDSTTGERWETVDEDTRNKTPIYLFSPALADHPLNLSDPYIKVSGAININPVIPTETIVINNYKYKDNPVNIVLPTSPTFKNTKITVDKIEIQ